MDVTLWLSLTLRHRKWPSRNDVSFPMKNGYVTMKNGYVTHGFMLVLCIEK